MPGIAVQQKTNGRPIYLSHIPQSCDRVWSDQSRTIVTNLLSNGNPALTGRTARGWSICRNWLRMQLAMIMSLRFFTPPLVDLVHPPDNMANISSIHVVEAENKWNKEQMVEKERLGVRTAGGKE